MESSGPKKKLIAILIIFSTIFSVRTVTASSCGESINDAENDWRVEQNAFRTGRWLPTYWIFLGTAFIRKVASLSADGHWLDQGAGSAGAMRQLFKLLSWRSGGTPLMTAIGVVKPQNKSLKNFEADEENARFQYIESTLEKLDADKIGKVDVISDLYGALSYVRDLRNSFIKSISFLKEGGDFFGISQLVKVTAKNKSGSSDMNRWGAVRYSDPGLALENIEYVRLPILKIIDENGLEVEVSQWLGAGRGFDIKVAKKISPFLFGERTLRLQITRTTGEIWLPPLELVTFEEGAPPVRLYRWNRSLTK